LAAPPTPTRLVTPANEDVLAVVEDTARTAPRHAITPWDMVGRASSSLPPTRGWSWRTSRDDSASIFIFFLRAKRFASSIAAAPEGHIDNSSVASVE
jgi:hypothetical protein